MSEARDRIIDVICENRKLKRKLNELIDELNGIRTEIDKQGMNNVLDYSEEYYKGLEDAWECAKKINCLGKDGGIQSDELVNIFGTFICYKIFNNFSASEAMARIKAYEEEQEEQKQIRVGDEVEIISRDDTVLNKCIVCGFVEKSANLLYTDGNLGQVPVQWCKKTGRHFDEVETLLKKMRGEE